MRESLRQVNFESLNNNHWYSLPLELIIYFISSYQHQASRQRNSFKEIKRSKSEGSMKRSPTLMRMRRGSRKGRGHSRQGSAGAPLPYFFGWITVLCTRCRRWRTRRGSGETPSSCFVESLPVGGRPGGEASKTWWDLPSIFLYLYLSHVPGQQCTMNIRNIAKIAKLP